MGPRRKIVHVDMDAFYASVEQRDRPELRGKPVIVGGPRKERGVVCTASYEARKFGVRSAMATARAARLCPQGIFIRPNMKKYAAVSAKIRQIFFEVTDLVEPLSLDEAYLDVTENHWNEPSATRVAERIRMRIRETTGLTASAGVAPNKFLAKVASDLKKPDGLTVIAPRMVADFVRELPVRKVPGIGKVTESVCKRLGIRNCGDFLRYPIEDLLRHFGALGEHLHDYAQGIDRRPVVVDQERRSCGIEDTFARDLLSLAEIEAQLSRLAFGLERRLAEANVRGRTITLKVKYSDFSVRTRRRTLGRYVRDSATIEQVGRELLVETEAGQRPIRLLGLSVCGLDVAVLEEQLQFPFLAEAEPDEGFEREATPDLDRPDPDVPPMVPAP